MSRATVESQLADFATALIENSGGIIDWQPDGVRATAIVPTELAESLGQHDDTFIVQSQPTEAGLTLSLGGEFVDLAARALRHFVPSVGTFAIENLPVRKTEFAAAVESSFGWQNARAKVLEGHAVTVPYHAWWFQATLQSEETWESLIPVTLNARSGVPVPLSGLLDLDALSLTSEPLAAVDSTLELAARVIEAETLRMAASFMQRVDTRRERDRKRLLDYYRAIQREGSTPNRRTKTAPTAEETETRTRAVKLELQRKLSELDERYMFSAVLRPVALAEFRIPAVAIDVEIHRKTQKRVFQVYWNGLLKQMEPMTCSGCRRCSWNFWFTNEAVDPLCPVCHDKKPKIPQ